MASHTPSPSPPRLLARTAQRPSHGHQAHDRRCGVEEGVEPVQVQWIRAGMAGSYRLPLETEGRKSVAVGVVTPEVEALDQARTTSQPRVGLSIHGRRSMAARLSTHGAGP